MKKQRVPRKVKKHMRHGRIIMDIQSIPFGVCVEEWLHYTKTNATIIWDSSNRGNKPEFIPFKKRKIKHKINIKDAHSQIK
jgi:hypothetical protein